MAVLLLVVEKLDVGAFASLVCSYRDLVFEF
jgi:hypothetical protein